MLKWALASGGIVLLFAILLSTTSQRKLFCLNLLTRRKGKKSWSWCFGSHSWAHSALAIVGLWHWHLDMVRGRKELKAYFFFQLSLSTNCFATAHNSRRQQSLNLPTTWICMISPLFFSALWAVFFFTQRPVVLCLIGPDIWKGPWIKKKKVVYDNWRTLLAAE